MYAVLFNCTQSPQFTPEELRQVTRGGRRASSGVLVRAIIAGRGALGYGGGTNWTAPASGACRGAVVG